MKQGLLPLSFLVISLSIQAEIFKCTDTHGNTSFQAQPCAENQSTEWSKETESERRQRIEKEKRAEQLRLMQEQKTQETLEQNAAALSGAPSSPGVKSEKDLWDEVDTPNEVKQATLAYLDKVLRDPDSLKDLQWVQTLDGIGEYKSLINYRATNAYGGYVRSEKVITVNRDGKVTDFKDYLPLPVWMQ